MFHATALFLRAGQWWFNQKNQIRGRSRGGIRIGQILGNATARPAFGGLALWQMPSTLDRNP